MLAPLKICSSRRGPVRRKRQQFLASALPKTEQLYLLIIFFDLTYPMDIKTILHPIRSPYLRNFIYFLLSRNLPKQKIIKSSQFIG
jgi:hypothetical protein